MLKAESTATVHLAEGDAQAVMSLFKRIAERGRKIRTSNSTTGNNRFSDQPSSALRDPSHKEGKSSEPSSVPEYDS